MAQTFHRYRAGDKPVGGYRLIRKLGEGGFGEVWQACAPGGAEVALKFIDLTGQQGFREFKALRLVKKVTHNNLTPLHGFWLKNEDGTLIDESDVTWSQLAPVAPNDPSISSALATAVFAHPVELIVAMGLGKKSLYDRLRECKDQGLAGIPADELLEYMDDAARGIDYLNRPIHDMGHGPVPIVHSDVKPHNILIVGDGAQVCDFGLAHAVEALRKTCAAPLTLAYAGPESFRGKPSDKSDQYSLAITYVELRTGSLPFDESLTGYEVMTAHVQGQLDFSRLLPGEESVIRKATSPLPQDRWRNCREMVNELRRALRLSTDSNFTTDPETVPDSRQTPLTQTMIPPGRGGDTDRDPTLTKKTPQTRPPIVLPAPPPDAATKTKRKVSTRAKLLVALLLLAGIGGAAALTVLPPDWRDRIAGWLNDQTNKDDGGDSGGEKQNTGEKQDTQDTHNTPPIETVRDQFDALVKQSRFDEALKLLEAPEFLPDEIEQQRADVLGSWSAYAKTIFHREHFKQAAEEYKQLAENYPDVTEVGDFRLMEARARAHFDINGARQVFATVSAPDKTDSPSSQIYYFVKLLTEPDESSDLDRLNDLYAASKQHTSASSAAANNDLWTATKSEQKLLNGERTKIVASWLTAAETRTATENLDGLTKIVDIDPANVDALVAKADAHWELNEPKEVANTMALRTKLEASPQPAWQMRAEALDCYTKLIDEKADEKSLNAALTDLPRLMSSVSKRRQLLAAAAVALAKRDAQKYSSPVVVALRSDAEADARRGELKRLFVELLKTEIPHRLVAAKDFAKAADQLRKDCELVAAEAAVPTDVPEVIRACHAESLLALNREGALAALGSAGTSPYYLFVKARVLSRDPNAAAEARTALQALFKTKPTVELRQSGRIAAAFDLVDRLVQREQATTEFNIQTALKAPPESTFGTIHEILAGAQAWSDATTKLSEPARARLAIAAWWHPQLKNETLARTLTAELVSSWRGGSDEKLDPSLVYRLYFTHLAAHRGSTEKSTQESMLAVADRLMSITKATKLDNTRAQAFYRAIVVPFQGVAENLKNDAYFASAADLVGTYPGLNWGVTDTAGKQLPSNDLREQLYTKAIELSAAPKLSYHVKRGQVRLKRKPFDLAAVLEDAKTLDRDAQFKVDAQLLRGQGYFSKSRDEQTNAARLEALNQALKALEATFDSTGKRESSDEEESRRLLLLSFVHLERRNFAGRVAGAVNDFQKAADYALQALKFLPQSDHKLAYAAAGNAYEDLAWFAGVEIEENYKKAVQNFQFAIDADPNSSLNHMNLGRCYYKMAAVSGIGLGKPLQSVIAQAETELTEAVKLAEPQGNAEAHYWLAKTRQVKHLTDRVPVEAARMKLNDSEFHAADKEVIRAVELAVSQNMPASALRVFVVEFAESVLLHPSFYSRDDTVRQNARLKVDVRIGQLRNYHLPRTVGLDMEQESKLLKARATRLTDSGVAALRELDATASALRQTEIDRTTVSDAKLMEFRLSVFDELRRDQRTPELTETRLKDAIWYAKLPLANRRKHAVPLLDAAQTEAEAAKVSDTAKESIFARYQRDWLKAAILSLPVNERANKWYPELLKIYESEVQFVPSDPGKSAAVRNRVAGELDEMARDLQKQGRDKEANIIRDRADGYRNTGNQPAKAAKSKSSNNVTATARSISNRKE